MDFYLYRYNACEDGIFSELISTNSPDMKPNFYVLEHAYPNDDGGFSPKVPNGTYQCVRGMHRLESMTSDFETFEVMGVTGHTGILFHTGNLNKDSAGCLLVGLRATDTSVMDSRAAFASFLGLQKDLDIFTLIVDDITNLKETS